MIFCNFFRISAAAINFEGTKSTSTKSPNEEEIYRECGYNIIPIPTDL